MCYANARSLGKLAGFMANKGTLGEEQLVSQATWEEMHAEPKYEIMCPIGDGCLFTKGGFAKFDLDECLKHERNEFWSSNPFAPQF